MYNAPLAATSIHFCPQNGKKLQLITDNLPNHKFARCNLEGCLFLPRTLEGLCNEAGGVIESKLATLPRERLYASTKQEVIHHTSYALSDKT